MGRPVYPHELIDPDFSWLISNFQENNPEYCSIDNSVLPVVFIKDETEFQQTYFLPEAKGESDPAPEKEK
ncbi:MAG: hypothetical protein KDD56_08260 [Bdellovibrionales bacterium]|nr:hypothetical protein [Bdellovibrionales bacterium]